MKNAPNQRLYLLLVNKIPHIFLFNSCVKITQLKLSLIMSPLLDTCLNQTNSDVKRSFKTIDPPTLKTTKLSIPDKTNLPLRLHFSP